MSRAAMLARPLLLRDTVMSRRPARRRSAAAAARRTSSAQPPTRADDTPYPGAPYARFVPNLVPAQPVAPAAVLPTFRVLRHDGRLDPAIAAAAASVGAVGQAGFAPAKDGDEDDGANRGRGAVGIIEDGGGGRGGASGGSRRSSTGGLDVREIGEAVRGLTRRECIALLQGMIRLRTLDTLCLQAHRQGRVPFYASSTGEEAAIVGTAAALAIRDEMFSQYREHGVLLYRIVEARRAARQGEQESMPSPLRTNPTASTLRQDDGQHGAPFNDTTADDSDRDGGFAQNVVSNDDEVAAYLHLMRQNVGSAQDLGRARQMAMHYGSPELCFQMVSSTIATQIPHAAGAAYALKRAGQSRARIAATFFGDGGSSEGDFHGGLNIAATMDAPVLFLCRNNGFAISTPSSEQFKCDGVAGRAAGGYGITAFRVDGNDALATLLAVRVARQFIIANQKPALVELMTYRGGDHSTSDDSSLYRDKLALDNYADPIERFAGFLESEHGWWNRDRIQLYFEQQRTLALKALEMAEAEDKPSPDSMFDDVYAGPLPQALRRQKDYLTRHLDNRSQV